MTHQSFRIAPRCLTAPSNKQGWDQQQRRLSPQDHRSSRWKTGTVYVLWRDIVDVFTIAQFVVDTMEGQVVPFMIGDDFKELEPKRIASHPDRILGMVVSPLSENLLERGQQEELQVCKSDTVVKTEKPTKERMHRFVLDRFLRKIKEFFFRDSPKILLRRITHRRRRARNSQKYTAGFAQSPAEKKDLIRLAIHVIQVPIIQEHHAKKQHDTALAGSAVLAEPSVLASITAIFVLDMLITLRLVGLRLNNISLPRLRHLTLDGVLIDSGKSATTLKHLFQSCDLESLAMVNADQDSDCIAFIINRCMMAKNLRYLKVLDLSNNNLRRESMTLVFEGVLSFWKEIDKLYLQGNMGPYECDPTEPARPN
ncbi:hypothetical protein KVV02_008823 [Mortierella alpina]|uniref:Uncharacterized protein n=1 Tax=Mortierella alpina TaxID=64518 RepID=A0A9P8CV17_MORAP|nr:hypothetical protein KVV02_008823 [Mortierella alpina]